MIATILIAIWFGISAHKAKNSIIGWVLIGALLSLAVSFLVSLLASKLMVTSGLAGTIRYDDYLTLRLVTAVISVVAMLIIGVAILPRPLPTDGHNTAKGFYNRACTRCAGEPDLPKAEWIADLQEAIRLRPQYREYAKRDKDFHKYWADPEFLTVVNSHDDERA